MSEVDQVRRKRKRMSIACTSCRKRKQKCDLATPCNNCKRSRSKESCVYESQLAQEQSCPSSKLEPDNSRNTATSAGPTNFLSVNNDTTNDCSPVDESGVAANDPVSTSDDIELLRDRIRQLEAQLSRVNLDSAGARAGPDADACHDESSSKLAKTTTSQMGVFHVLFEKGSASEGLRYPRIRSIFHKQRLFGRSHWSNRYTVLWPLIELIEPQIRDKTSKASRGLQDCKTVAKNIKLQWTPLWPTPVTVGNLPPKLVTDRLVNCYLRTVETTYRILHVPSFWKDYEALWVSDPSQQPNTALSVLLKLVLAIGAATYDDTFSLRPSAIRWIYEAQTWLSEPLFKTRLGIQCLQINILLVLAQEIVSSGEDLRWMVSGMLIRSAMDVGLHRDPSYLPKMALLASEMRRRLWNTILELVLQASLASGGAPLISMQDFDTQPPGNYTDEQLLAEGIVVEKPQNVFTQTSIAIALRKTFEHRLEIAKLLNDLSSDCKYEDVLRLDAEFRASYRVLSRTLQECKNNKPGPGQLSPSHYELRVVDFIMRSSLLSLHSTYFAPALCDHRYEYSRRTSVETALRICQAVFPSSSSSSSASLSSPLVPGSSSYPGTTPTSVKSTTPSLSIGARSAISGPGQDDGADADELLRLTICGSGTFNYLVFQSSFIIANEMVAQLQSEEGLEPSQLRPDLMAVVESSKEWALKRVFAGETNIKGYLLLNFLAAHIGSLSRGASREEMARTLIKAAEDAEDNCLSILEQLAAGLTMTSLPQEQAPPPPVNNNLDSIDLNVPSQLMEDWDFMMTDVFLGNGNPNFMSWVL